MRTRLTQERTPCFQRLEKLLEGALIKLSSVASELTTLSAQDMIRAMIAGERDPQALAAGGPGPRPDEGQARRPRRGARRHVR